MNNPTIIHYKARLEQVLHDVVYAADIPARRIKEAIFYSLFPGGKRLRPILVYLCGELFDTNARALDTIAAAIELVHSFSLVHDDLPAMDNDDLRRGIPSCHRAFDEATAILVGDGMQALAIDTLLCQLPLSLTMPQVVAVAHELLLASGPSGMVSGQSLDMTELTNPNISEAQLCEIHLLKTGKLILACINMVLAASETSEASAKALRQFAMHLGLLFQMQDDYLDRYSHSDSLGKGRSSDSANEKQTFANLYDEARLAQLIQDHIDMARQALAQFGTKARNLLDLLSYVQNRISEKNCKI
ncbi:MAG: polyprenyl synthetase family protein [Legionellaceae bacterium]|nr:polyprenyl synthetase family protein [Legionellaceae bacterium]